VRFGERSERLLRDAIADELYTVLGGRDLVVDAGFGPDTDRALIELAFARAGPELDEKIAEAHRAFDVEMASRPRQMSFEDAVRVVLRRMAQCTSAAWLDFVAEAPASAQLHRERRQGWLDRLTRLQPDDAAAVADLVAAVEGEPAGGAVATGEPLGSAALEAVFDVDIAPETLIGEASPQPWALLLCRGPEPLPALRLAEQRGGVAIDPDMLTAYHPHAAAGVDGQVRHDAVLWTVMAVGYAVEHRLDAVVQTAADEPDQIGDVAAVFADADYRVTVYPETDDPVEPGEAKQEPTDTSRSGERA
jgi:hypothetical protein